MSHQSTTEYINVNGIRTAYRELGHSEGVPLLLLQYFTGTMDNWDPVIVQVLAARRSVILLDNAGVGASNGETPDTVDQMTIHVIAFIDALKVHRIDVLGFSLASFIAQKIVEQRPELVRKVILVGSCARGQGADSFRQVIADVADSDCTEVLLQLFFTPTRSSQALGLEFVRRLSFRDEHGTNLPQQVFSAQYRAIESWGETPLEPSTLHSIKHPVLVVQGGNDTMFPTPQSVDLFNSLPNAQLSLYSDSGHASLLQYPAMFSEQANYFLETS